MKPEGRDAIINKIGEVAKRLKGVPNYKPESTIITITGTANNKPATSAAGGPETELDHRGEAYGGNEPNNEYLAYQRALSVRNAIASQFDDGVKFKIESKVVPTEREQDKYIYVTAHSEGDVKSVKVTGDIKLGFTSDLQIVNGNQLAAKHGYPAP